MNYYEAMAQLTVSAQRKAADLIKSALDSARFNAENQLGLDPTKLYVCEFSFVCLFFCFVFVFCLLCLMHTIQHIQRTLRRMLTAKSSARVVTRARVSASCTIAMLG